METSFYDLRKNARYYMGSLQKHDNILPFFLNVFYILNIPGFGINILTNHVARNPLHDGDLSNGSWRARALGHVSATPVHQGFEAETCAVVVSHP